MTYDRLLRRIPTPTPCQVAIAALVVAFVAGVILGALIF